MSSTLPMRTRNPADLAQVDADQVAGDRPPGLLPLVACRRGFRVLMGNVEDINALIREHPHDAVECLGGKVAGVDGHGDIAEGHRTVLPGPGDQVSNLVGLPRRG